MENKLEISVVIPVFNEEGNLDELVDRCLKSCRGIKRSFEIILVDDGSQDGSALKIESAATKYSGEIIGIFFNRNYGQHAAIVAGLDCSRGNVVVTLDADLQNPPEEIPRLLGCIDKGFDVVGSVRRNRKDSLFRRLSSFLINKSVQKATGVLMHDYGCMLRAYHRTVVDAMLSCNEHSTFIPVLANSFSRNPTEIEVDHFARNLGDSKYGILKLVKLMFDLLTCMTTFPLRLLSIMGIMISCMGVSFGIFLLIMRLVYGSAWAAEGVFTLFAILFIFIGAQFIGMGLLGEYIGRIYHDVRNRPRYFIHKIVRASNKEKEKI